MTTRIVNTNISVITPPPVVSLLNRSLIIDLGNTNLPVWNPANQSNPSLWQEPTVITSPTGINSIFPNTNPNATRTALVQFFANQVAPYYPAYVLNFGSYQAFQAATAGNMQTGTLGSIPTFNAVTNGGFSVSVDGTLINITGLNFSLAANNTDISGIINANATFAAKASANVAGSGTALIFTSDTTGSTSAVSALSAPTGPGITDISGASFLNALTGVATLTPGTNSGGTMQNLTQYLASLQFSASPFYWILLPQQLYTDSTFPTLAGLYAQDSSIIYFLVDPTDVVIAPGGGLTGVTWDTVNGLKSVMGAKNCASSALGILVSVGVPPAELLLQITHRQLFGVPALTSADQASYIAKHIAYPDNISTNGAASASPSVYLENAVLANGDRASKWISINGTVFALNAALTSALLNNANNSVSPFGYNQAGINILQSVIEGTLDSLVTNRWIGPNPIVTAVDFNTYTAQHPADYDAGIYNGFAIQVQIGSFILTLGLNVTLTSTPTVTITSISAL